MSQQPVCQPDYKFKTATLRILVLHNLPLLIGLLIGLIVVSLYVHF